MSTASTRADGDKPFRLSVKLVLTDAQGRCLLLRRSEKTGNFPGQWDLPGGKIDPGEDFIRGLSREVREETALEVHLNGLVTATEFEMPAAKVIMLALKADFSGGTIHLSEEHQDFRWVTLAEAEQLDLVDHVRVILRVYAQDPK